MTFRNERLSYSRAISYLSFLPLIQYPRQKEGELELALQLRKTFCLFQSESEVRGEDPGRLVQQPGLDRPERCQREKHGGHVYSATKGDDVTCPEHVSVSRIL